MLLDIGTVIGGIGLAIVGFIVVIVVCVVILRLLAAILPSYEDRSAPQDPVEGAESSPSEEPDAVPEAGEAAEGTPLESDLAQGDPAS